MRSPRHGGSVVRGQIWVFFFPSSCPDHAGARAGFSHRSHFVGCDQFSVIWLVWFPPRFSEDAASNPVSRCFLIFLYLGCSQGNISLPILNYTKQRLPLVRINVTRIIEKKEITPGVESFRFHCLWFLLCDWAVNPPFPPPHRFNHIKVSQINFLCHLSAAHIIQITREPLPCSTK